MQGLEFEAHGTVMFAARYTNGQRNRIRLEAIDTLGYVTVRFSY
jgi:hypothetical protein